RSFEENWWIPCQLHHQERIARLSGTSSISRVLGGGRRTFQHPNCATSRAISLVRRGPYGQRQFRPQWHNMFVTGVWSTCSHSCAEKAKVRRDGEVHSRFSRLVGTWRNGK